MFMRRKVRSTRSLKLDQRKRSAQPWETGKRAKRKGNPRYKAILRKGKDGVIRKLYVRRL